MWFEVVRGVSLDAPGRPAAHGPHDRTWFSSQGPCRRGRHTTIDRPATADELPRTALVTACTSTLPASSNSIRTMSDRDDPVALRPGTAFHEGDEPLESPTMSSLIRRLNPVPIGIDANSSFPPVSKLLLAVLRLTSFLVDQEETRSRPGNSTDSRSCASTNRVGATHAHGLSAPCPGCPLPVFSHTVDSTRPAPYEPRHEEHAWHEDGRPNHVHGISSA